VPRRRTLTLDAATPTDDRNDELADLLQASVGENLGFRYLPAARPARPDDLGRMSADFASQVRWLDWLTMNPDRTPENPNLLADGAGFWLIDHGAALPFQYDWARVTEDTPRRAEFAGEHALTAAATRLAAWDPLLTAMLTREVLADVVAQVPDSFLRPLVPAQAGGDGLARRRAAYAAVLWKRLGGPRVYAAVPGSVLAESPAGFDRTRISTGGRS